MKVPVTTAEWFTADKADVSTGYANFVVANSDTDGIFDREFFRGRPDPLSSAEHVLYWNEEFRATLWGHLTLVNLKQVVEPVMTGFKDTTNPWDIPTNADIAERAQMRFDTIRAAADALMAQGLLAEVAVTSRGNASAPP